jgi:predicted acylesterase/phospholipase RssA
MANRWNTAAVEEQETMDMMDNTISRSDKGIGLSLPGQIVLVLQGGGALGSYQAGVYQALHEAGIEPDWIIGTSIGAINASAGKDQGTDKILRRHLDLSRRNEGAAPPAYFQRPFTNSTQTSCYFFTSPSSTSPTTLPRDRLPKQRRQPSQRTPLPSKRADLEAYL